MKKYIAYKFSFKSLLRILLILFFTAFAIDVNADNLDVYPQNSNYWTGSCTSGSKTQTSLVRGYDTEDGWMKFDISGVPDGSTITGVEFHGYVNSTNWAYWSITPVTNDPVPTSAATLNADIIAEQASGYYLYQSEGSGYPTGWKIHSLIGNVNSDLQSALGSDWFAIGIASRDNNTSYYIIFDGWNETNKPFLRVTYTPPANSSPNAPTLYNTGGSTQLCFNNAYIFDDTPTFRVSATDDDADAVDFRIEIDNNSDFSSIIWTRDFTSYASGSTNDLTCTALSGIADGTTYYVQVKAIDPGGSNTYGNYSSGTYSFTYKSSGATFWHQTTEAQFDSDNLSGCSTPGDYVGGISTTAIPQEQIGAGNDDAFDYSDGLNYPASVNCRIGYRAGVGFLDCTGGFRFQTVPVPQGATITTATLSLRAYDAVSPTINTKISADDADNSSDFSASRPSSRTKTTSQVDWDVSSSWSTGTYYNSPEIKTVLQEVVARAGWVSNNNLSIIIANDGGSDNRNVSTYDENTGYGARLNITYVEDGTAISSMIEFASFNGATSWNQVSWNETETNGSVSVKVQKFSGTWIDAGISGPTSPLDITSLGTESQIRLVATLTYSGGSPSLDDWTVSLGYGDSESDIVKKSGFTEPTNIAYGSYQTASGLTTGNALKVAEFTIRDGGADFTDSDSKNTTLTDITFTIANFANIRALAIFDGSTNKKEVTSVTVSTVFASISGLLCTDGDADGYDFALYATFNSSVTDNDNLKFTVSSATASGAGSVFATSDAGGATTDDTGDNNEIIVTATKWVFSTQPSSSVCVNIVLPQQPALTAKDANDNIDVDYSGSITLSQSGSLTMSQSPPAPASGVATFSGFTFTTGGETVSLSANDGSLTSDANSNDIDVKESPTVTTTAISSITPTTASSGGNVTSVGLGTVSARGVCWNTSTSPTTADSKTTDGSGSGVFASSITGLTACTQYYVRAYATNECGTSYGSEVSFYATCESSDIITAGNETSNIDYASKTGASIGSTADAIRVWSFTIRDGGGASDADVFGTELTDVTIDKGGSNGVTSWANTIRQAALYDGATEVAEISVSGETMTFSGMSGANVTASDNGNKTLDLYLTFETTNITDNQQFQFQITNGNVTEGTTGSSNFGAFSTVTSSVTGDNGRIEVTATKLAFDASKPPTQVQLGINFNVTVNAVDANDILDLDQNSSIILALNTGTGTVSSATGLTQSLSLGTYAWTDVQYDTEEIFKIEAQSGTLTDAVSININCTDVMDIDFESDNGGFSGTGEWEWGAPGATSINTANGGTNCWGTDLDNTYQDNQDIYLTSPVYKTTNTSVDWKYWEAKEIENEGSCGWDYIIPQYKINSGSWTNVTAKVCPMTPTTWGQQSWTISSGISVGDDIQFRWYLHTDASQTEEGWYIDDVQFKYVTTVPTTVTLYNTSATAGEQIMFNGSQYSTTTPIFAASATNSRNFNTFQVELNTKPDFTGTSYTQTISGTYSSSTKYNLNCNSLSPSLPTTNDAVYFVRVRAAADGGTNWSSWSHDISSQWIFIKRDTDQGMCYTTEWQFDQGTATTGINYGNFVSASDNGTTTNYQDDYLQIDEGSSDNSLITASDQALIENTSWYSGASNNCITVGYYNITGRQDYHGFRYQSADIPQGATILTSTFTPYAHSGSGCGGSTNTTNQLIMRIRGVDQDNCNAWANNTNTATGDPKNRVRTTSGINWNVPAGASQQWSTGLLITTAPDITTIIQEIVNRASYAAGNAIGLIVDHNSGVGNYWRYFATMSASATYSARLQTTFTNFYNEYELPDIQLASFESDGGTVEWKELIFTDDIAGCGACNIQYQVHNASTDAILVAYTRGTVGVVDISAATTTASIYVRVKIQRNDSPKLTKIIVTTSNSVVLLVELLSFTAQNEGDNVRLNWTTKSEINNDYFTVEKSTNADDFDIVVKVPGAGNSSHTLYYSEVDEDPYYGISYYRLKQTDYDGKYEYSDLVAVEFLRKLNFSVRPNPVNDYLEVTFGKVSKNIIFVMTPEYNATIKIFDNKGQLVYEKLFDGTFYKFNINVSSFSQGMYFVTLITDNELYKAKFVKEE